MQPRLAGTIYSPAEQINWFVYHNMNWCKHQSGCSQINWFFTTIWIVGVFVIQTWQQCLSRICKVSWLELFIKINWFFTSASIYDLNMELVVKKMQPRLVGSIYSPAEQIDWYFITIQILVLLLVFGFTDSKSDKKWWRRKNNIFSGVAWL